MFCGGVYVCDMNVSTIIAQSEEERKKGNLLLITATGAMLSEIDLFIQQPVSGILYDLNRGREVTATLAKDDNNVRYINDYAVAIVIEALKERIEALEIELNEAINNNG